MISHTNFEARSDENTGNGEWNRNELFALLAHEIRNSTQGIITWADLICKQASSDETKLRGLEAIRRNSRLQVKLINQLLELSRRNRGDLPSDDSQVALIPILDAAINTVTPRALENSIKLQVDIEPSSAAVMGDPSQLEEVFTNILSNAIKFTPTGGRVEVTFRSVDGEAQTTISDTGCGIGAEFLPHVFERYRQEKKSSDGDEGQGLGLAISRFLIERHAGRITASSAGVGKGATFTVCLPLAAKLLSRNRPLGFGNPTALNRLPG